ncbi:hypothetical protein D9757_001150 [Collybiopsis confluens]|uniref:DUF6535 domain-containing protein n=1 Tax=Collybiopsis confluens TaxID=2823264 RepID=A0A8H5I123_9AGAR|nr:hypothetical protein D9757_001150 [Collybiopsis confluens]
MRGQFPDSGPKHLFGIPQSKDRRVFNDDNDYEQRFPEDPPLRETDPNARVWRTYLAESAIFDENMIGEARDGLDSMLVFAGLFSAVVTTLLVQAAQNLQPNYTQLSATLLYELLSNPGGGGSAPPNPASKFVPDPRDVWINSLWAVSLTFGLIVALASVLIKQWLRRYLAFHSGTPAERSHLRQYRYMGFETWQVSTIVGSLPVIMHLSLALFLAGLVLFFVPLHFALSYVIGSITGLVYALYFVSNILPIFFPQCPYRTPLSVFFLFLGRLPPLVVHGLRKLKHSPKEHLRVEPESFWSSLDDREKAAVFLGDDLEHVSLSLKALHWLYTVSTNTSVHSIVMQAIGGLPALKTIKKDVQSIFNFETDCKSVLEHLIFSCTSMEPNSLAHVPTPQLESVLERLCRTSLFFPVQYESALGSIMSSIEYHCKPEEDPESVLRQGTFLSVGLSLRGQDYLDFILAHGRSQHHHFVWAALMEHATLCADDYEEHQYSTQTIISYYDNFFMDKQDEQAEQASKLFRLSHSDPLVEGDLMTFANCAKYTSVIKSWMLRMLADHDAHPHLPRDNRIIEAMLGFLLENQTSISEVEFWSHLKAVFEHFDLIQADRVFQEDKSCDFNISSFIIEISNKWISRPQVRSSALAQLLAEEVETYWQPKCLGTSELNMIRATIQFHPHDFVDFAVLTSGLLAALLCGSVGAYRTFVDSSYLLLLFNHRMKFRSIAVEIVGTFVMGLEAVEEMERTNFVDYLFNPRNARIALILMILEREDNQCDREFQWKYSGVVRTFAQLCPQRHWLVDHRGWLALILKNLETTSSTSREQLGKEMGISLTLFSPSFRHVFQETIECFDEYLAETETQPESSTSQDHVVQRHPDITPGSSLLQELETSSTQSLPLHRTSASMWAQLRNVVRAVGPG